MEPLARKCLQSFFCSFYDGLIKLYLDFPLSESDRGESEVQLYKGLKEGVERLVLDECPHEGIRGDRSSFLVRLSCVFFLLASSFFVSANLTKVNSSNYLTNEIASELTNELIN